MKNLLMKNGRLHLKKKLIKFKEKKLFLSLEDSTSIAIINLDKLPI